MYKSVKTLFFRSFESMSKLLESKKFKAKKIILIASEITNLVLECNDISMRKNIQRLLLSTVFFYITDVRAMSSISTEQMICSFSYVAEAKVLAAESIKCASRDLQDKCIYLSRDFGVTVKISKVIATKEISWSSQVSSVRRIGIGEELKGVIRGLGLPRPIQEMRYSKPLIKDLDEEIKTMNTDINDHVIGKSFIVMINFIDNVHPPKFSGLAWQLDSKPLVLDTLLKSSQKSCAKAI